MALNFLPSSISIDGPPLTNAPNEAGSADITKLAWPTWSRTTGRLGGDLVARFTFEPKTANEAEAWLDRLGYKITESTGGEPTFSGYIDTVRATIGGATFVASLDDLANSVKVYYKTSSGGGEGVTTTVTNSGSQNRYGTREKWATPTAYMDGTAANQYRDNLLALGQWPTPRLAGLTPGSNMVVAVTVKGYVATMNWKLTSGADTALYYASNMVLNMVNAAEFVTVGEVEENQLLVTNEFSRTGLWDRAKAVAELGHLSGGPVAAMVQDQLFYYRKIDTGTPKYYVSIGGDGGQTVLDSGGNIVHPGTIVPGVVAIASDVLGGRALANPVLDDPRAFIVDSVTYTKQGAKIHVADKLEDVRMVILGQK